MINLEGAPTGSKEEFKKELDFIFEKLTYVSLPEELQSKIETDLKTFANTYGESKIDELKEVSKELDMIQNYKVILTKIALEGYNSKEDRAEEMQEAINKANASLLKISHILQEGDYTEH
jgi:hypothetical protein